MPLSKYSIEVNNLTKKFGAFISVNAINFNVETGSIFGFLGANGAGKSTTIKMLTGLLNPTSGDARVGEYSILRDPEKVKANIGYMSQKFSLYNDLTIKENITFFGRIYGLSEKELQIKMRHALNISQLEGQENVLTGSLPGGIKQRLVLATAVLHNPPIIFLDEPTSGVDPISRRNFWELIHTLSDAGTTVFVTTHYLEEAEYCHKIILINAGELIAEGSPTKLKTDYMKFPILRIDAPNQVPVLELLEKIDSVKDISIFGSHLHAIVEQQEHIVDYYSKLLLSSDIPFLEIKQIQPTLEDVFIYLLEQNQKSVH